MLNWEFDPRQSWSQIKNQQPLLDFSTFQTRIKSRRKVSNIAWPWFWKISKNTLIFCQSLIFDRKPTKSFTDNSNQIEINVTKPKYNLSLKQFEKIMKLTDHMQASEIFDRFKSKSKINLTKPKYNLRISWNWLTNVQTSGIFDSDQNRKLKWWSLRF